MKKIFKTYKLKFNSPFHISSGGFALESSDAYIRSDTIFSAICSTSRLLYEDDIINKFLDEQSFFISSGFPYYKDEYYFPKPLNYHFKATDDYNILKKLKRIKYIPPVIFEDIINGKNNEIAIDDKRIIQGVYMNAQPEKDFTFYKETEIPRVVIDRITNSTNIFNFSQVSYNSDAGIYFIVDFENPDLEKYFEASLGILGDEGIGADGTVGKGLFEFEKDELKLEIPDKSEYYLMLSLYSPKKTEVEKINFKESFYDFNVRRGWISYKGLGSLRRKSIRMVNESSVLKVNNYTKLIGENKIVFEKNTVPEAEFDVIRYGKCLSIPIIIN